MKPRPVLRRGWKPGDEDSLTEELSARIMRLLLEGS